MDNEARLLAAMAASAAPGRDPGFTLAVLHAAERYRYRQQALRSVLRMAGLAAAAAGLALPLLGWIASHPAGVLNGLVGSASLMVIVGGARLMSARVTAVLHR